MNKILIGMIHLEKIRGINKDSIKHIISKAKSDLKNLEKAGFKYACIINENDIPYNIKISSDEENVFKKIAKELKKISNISLGVCVLYNDWKAALNIAKSINANFVRIDTFVDLVKSDAGIIKPEADKIMKYKEQIKLKKLKIFTDIHPKYKKILEKKSLIESGIQAETKGSDGIIITGNKSGEIINLNKIKKIKKYLNINIFLGSGVSESNIEKYRNYIDGAFIGTSIKDKGKISLKKAKSFIKLCNTLENSPKN